MLTCFSQQEQYVCLIGSLNAAAVALLHVGLCLQKQSKPLRSDRTGDGSHMYSWPLFTIAWHQLLHAECRHSTLVLICCVCLHIKITIYSAVFSCCRTYS